MRPPTRFASSLAVASIFLTGSAVAAVAAPQNGAPAALPAAMRDCPNGYLCLWEDINFQGRRLQFRDSGEQDLYRWNFKDKASSVFNRTNRTARLINTYSPLINIFQKKEWFDLPANHYSANLNDYRFPNSHSTLNDRIDKINIVG